MKSTIGSLLLLVAFIGLLTNHYLISDEFQTKLVSFITAIGFVCGIFLIIPNFIFDPLEWEKNKSVEGFIYKFRLRAILFNNISVAIFLTILVVILIGFYLLVNPFPLEKSSEQIKQLTNIDNAVLSSSLTIRISSSVLLIFLVGILFRVFKYLLRVAAFYHSKADALEFYKMNPETKLELEKLLEIFTPEKYDISDLEQSSIATNIVDLIKTKLGR
jgi:hypothetical protein